MKRLAFETLMDLGTVRVLIWHGHPDVCVPVKAIGKSRYVALDYSKKFSMPLFKVTDDGIRAKLSFGGVEEHTFIPWDAVVAVLQNGKVMEFWGEGIVVDTVDQKWVHQGSVEA